MRVVKAICNTLSSILIGILVLLAAGLFVPKLLGFEEYVVLSGSMEPTIHVGSICYDKDVAFDDIKVGDVLTYRFDVDTNVTHRVVAVDSEEKLLTTKGDANTTEDGRKVSPDMVVGVVKFSIPLIGYVATYIRTGIGIGIGASVLALIILLGFIPELFEKTGEDNKKKTNK